MKSRYLLLAAILVLGMLLEQSYGAETESDSIDNRGSLIREKRAPIGLLGKKALLLGGVGLLGKKALVLGGAAVGAKALVGAGVIGAGLYKAKYYGGGYGHVNVYPSHHYYAPQAYVHSGWSQPAYWGR